MAAPWCTGAGIDVQPRRACRRRFDEKVLTNLPAYSLRACYVSACRFDDKSIAGVLGGLTNTDVLRAECSWRATASGVFAVACSTISAGGRTWVPADRQAKGIRAVSACTPVYLDDELLVLRGQIQEVIYVWERSDGPTAERVGNYVDPIAGK